MTALLVSPKATSPWLANQILRLASRQTLVNPTEVPEALALRLDPVFHLAFATWEVTTNQRPLLIPHRLHLPPPS